MEIILILIAIIALLSLEYIKIYNKIQDNLLKIEKAKSIIDQDLREKYDLITKINTYFTNVENKNQKDYLKELKNIDPKEISSFELERKLMTSENTLLDLYNDKNEYQENQEIKDLFKELKTKNEKIIAGVSYFNNYTSQLNSYIRKIPQNIVALISHTKQSPFFDGKERH